MHTATPNKFNTMKLLQVYILLLLSVTAFAQQTPAPKQSQAITISGGTAHLGNGTKIENALITFKNGVITAVGNQASATPVEGTVIDATGKHIYPGIIAPNATLGLAEIDAVRATRDNDEVGLFNPHIRSLIAYNTESKVTETMRPNGVLLGQITPRGGRISGTSSVVQFDAWNWEDAVIKADDGIHLNWPRQFSVGGGSWFSGLKYNKINKSYNSQVEAIKTYFTEALSYYNSDRSDYNLPFDGMVNVFKGSKKLFIHVNSEQSIIDAINFANSYNINNITLVGAYQAYKLIPLLKQHKVSVLLNRVHDTPNAEDDDYDLPFKMAKLLVDGGVLVGLQTQGDMERMNTRNLPFYAGTTAAYGLDKEIALQLITENNAKILGINNAYGTLEVGKSATLFISKGDALDMRTNQLEKAFIDGRDISLESHQTQLWKKYTNKYKNAN